MANTLSVQVGAWRDLAADVPLEPGKGYVIQNVGGRLCYLYESDTAITDPATVAYGYILQPRSDIEVRLAAGSALYAWCSGGLSRLVIWASY